MVGGVKDKVMSLFKIISTKDYNKLTHINDLYEGGKKSRKLKMKKSSEDIMNLFEQEKNY